RPPRGAPRAVLHRQRRHDSLGRHRAAAPWQGRCVGFPPAAALAAQCNEGWGDMTGRFDVFALFPTPVVHFEVPDSAALNVDLKAVIEQQQKFDTGTEHSNLGGWQSSWKMDKWGGVAAIKLLAYARNNANRVTCDRQGQPVAITWKANMWANVNRSGHGNEFHCHPACFWSGVYYVDDGGIGADPSLGGELELMDPRAPGSVMYAPHLG